MSATNRGSKRRPLDAYYTPSFCVARLLEAVELPTDKLWLEPAAGLGSVIQAVSKYSLHKPTWDAAELNFWAYPVLRPMVQNLYLGKFQDQTLEKGKYGVVISNPPFDQAMEFIVSALALQPQYVVFLLRTNFLESETRADFLRNNAPDLFVLPQRPSFSNNGKTDATSYSWFVWGSEPKNVGTCQVLNSTPKNAR